VLPPPPCAGAHGTNVVSSMKKKMISFTIISLSFSKYQDSVSFYSIIMWLERLNHINDGTDDSEICLIF
jgi:hypothetical protein